MHQRVASHGHRCSIMHVRNVWCAFYSIAANNNTINNHNVCVCVMQMYVCNARTSERSSAYLDHPINSDVY